MKVPNRHIHETDLKEAARQCRQNFDNLDRRVRGETFTYHLLGTDIPWEPNNSGDLDLRIYPNRIEIAGTLTSQTVNGKIADLPVTTGAAAEVAIKADDGSTAWLFLTTSGELHMQNGAGPTTNYNVSVSMPYRSA